MRRLLCILAMAFFAASASAAPMRPQTNTTALDSAARAKVDAMLDDYLAALAHEDVQTKTSEVDFILSACQTDKVRDYVARKVYAHYLSSPIMGDEAVAVHLTDDWFVTGRATMATDIDLLNARIYADFNRSSLIGSRAPSLLLLTPSGDSVEALGIAHDTSAFAGPSQRNRVLYFYSPDCVNCRAETPLLVDMLAHNGFPIDLIAIDTDDDRDEWDEWRDKFDGIGGTAHDAARVMHFWDPSVESDFQRKYGVLQTPRMFLIDTSGIIIGRGLDVPALESMLTSAYGILDYGSAESTRFFDALFLTAADSSGSYVATAKYLASRLDGKGNLFRQYIGDMLYYLNGKPGAEAKEALRYTADSLILCRPDIWATHDDSLKVVGLAEIASDLLGRADIGTKIPDLRLNGTLLSWRRTSLPAKEKEHSLRKLPGRWSYIVFYTEGCPNCEEEKAGISRFLSGWRDDKTARHTAVLMIDLDHLSEERRIAALDAFDLTNLPYITRIDSNGTVIGRWLFFSDK